MVLSSVVQEFLWLWRSFSRICTILPSLWLERIQAKDCRNMQQVLARGQGKSFSSFPKENTMKKLMLIVAVLLMACAPIQADLTAWGLSADNADTLLETRLGWETDRIEPGLGFKWFTRDPEWGPEPDVVSGYLIYHVDELVQVEDETPDNPLEEFLHGLAVRPYAGLELAVPTQGEQRQVQTNFLVGTLFSLDSEFKRAFVVEYIEGEGAILPGDRRAVKLGFRLRF
jgi:hypothetical protein